MPSTPETNGPEFLGQILGNFKKSLDDLGNILNGNAKREEEEKMAAEKAEKERLAEEARLEEERLAAAKEKRLFAVAVVSYVGVLVGAAIGAAYRDPETHAAVAGWIMAKWAVLAHPAF